MKRLLVVLLALALMTGTTVYALHDTRDCAITLNVPADFYLDLPVTTWINFGTIIDGQSTASENLAITTVSTTGNDWELRFRNTPMASETDSSNVIPDSNCNIQFNTGGAGTPYYTGGGNFPGSGDAVLYVSSSGETGSLNHNAVLSVDVPAGQASGWYRSVITFTMIEV